MLALRGLAPQAYERLAAASEGALPLVQPGFDLMVLARDLVRHG